MDGSDAEEDDETFNLLLRDVDNLISQSPKQPPRLPPRAKESSAPAATAAPQTASTVSLAPVAAARSLDNDLHGAMPELIVPTSNMRKLRRSLVRFSVADPKQPTIRSLPVSFPHL